MAGISNKPTHLAQSVVTQSHGRVDAAKHCVERSIEPRNFGSTAPFNKALRDVTVCNRVCCALNLF
jgi:hypothetical protein